MKPLRPGSKTHDDLALEWDRIATLRLQQIESGVDISYKDVLTPAIWDLAAGADLTSVLDVGCGVGVLTAELAACADQVVGVDLSAQSVQLAQTRFGQVANASFAHGRIEEFVSGPRVGAFSLAVANMTLMTALSLKELLCATAAALRPGGHLIFTITHPWFWPFYWQYEQADWFDYKSEIVIEAPFRISQDNQSEVVTTHVHRPLEAYVQALIDNGFVIEHFAEPMPSAAVEKRYPEPWRYPRFLAGRCRRSEEAQRTRNGA